MFQTIFFLIIIFGAFETKACTEKMYCVQKNNLIYLSFDEFVMINFKTKFTQNRIKFPKILFDKVKGKACSLKCSEGQISLLSSEKEYFLKLTPNSKIEVTSEKQGPQPNMGERTLGIGADQQPSELYTDSTIKVEIKVIKSEETKEFRGKPFREDSYETLIIKKDKQTGKELERLSVFKDSFEIH